MRTYLRSASCTAAAIVLAAAATPAVAYTTYVLDYTKVQDTYVIDNVGGDYSYQYTTHNTEGQIGVGNFGFYGYQRGLVKFDMSGLPSGRTMTSATLTFTNSFTNSTSAQYSVFRGLLPWQANDASFTYRSNASSTYWITGGGPPYGPSGNGQSFATTPTDTQTFNFPYGSPYVPASLTFNVLADASAFYLGTATNNGWLFKQTTAGVGGTEQPNNGGSWYSSEGTTDLYNQVPLSAGQKPILILELAPEPGFVWLPAALGAMMLRRRARRV